MGALLTLSESVYLIGVTLNAMFISIARMGGIGCQVILYGSFANSSAVTAAAHLESSNSTPDQPSISSRASYSSPFYWTCTHYTWTRGHNATDGSFQDPGKQANMHPNRRCTFTRRAN